jgi:ABC-type dipeptide/oligopeptide/nickel transport system permease subunit
MIISDARLYLLSKPYLLIFPVILIFVLTVSLHVLADEVRDYFDRKKNLINFAEYSSVSSIKENYENE